MKERPILFSAPMVRAILAGKKTQTRRIVKPQPEPFVTKFAVNEHGVGISADEAQNHVWKCPYGVAGDRLWVRETWTPDHAAFYPNFPCVYRADAGYEYERNERGEVYSPEQKAWYPYHWRPSIHMPRWASRITLEVVAVHAERVQEITNNDAMDEGFDGERWLDSDGSEGRGVEPWEQFRDLWHKINGPESWDANPWVWVVEFKRVASA